MNFDDGAGFEEPQGEPLDGAVQPSGTAPVGQDNVVILPPGATLDSISAEGRDLVITLADGSRTVIPDGAVFVPQIVINGVTVPPETITQLLADQEPEPAAGPPGSSGGNFAADEGEIQAAFDIGNLLPFTDFGFTSEEEEEFFPTLEDDEEPTVVIETVDNPAGAQDATASVDEEGLPLRGEGESAGTNEPSSAETTTGTITFVSPDGPSTVLINGTEVTGAGQIFETPLGTLTIISFDPEAGTIDYSYTLSDNTTDPTVSDVLDVTVIDADGDEATATLTITVVDDAPIAADDTNEVPAGSFEPITGDVLINDVAGADGFPTEGGVSGFSNDGGSAAPGESLQGEYGVLTLNADGTYSYARDVNTPGGVADTFEYTIVDQDGSTSSAILTINIEDSPAEITFVPETGDGTEVAEAGLPPRGAEPVGSGEGADADPDNNSDPSESTGSTITFESPDGVSEITIGGTPVVIGSDPQEIPLDDGTLVITDVTFDPETGEGSITFEFTLDDNTEGDDTSFDIDVTIIDLDGDSASDTLTINVADDVPTATDDVAVQAEEDAPVTVDVFANDVEGADGVALDTIALVDGTLDGEGTLVNNGDGTFTYTPVPGEEGVVTFDYTITDSDGDTSTATVTIELLEDSTPEIGIGELGAEGLDSVDEAGLPAREDEPAGSDEASDSESTDGIIVIETGNDTVGSLVINGVDVTNGGLVTTPSGQLTVTFSAGVYSYTYDLLDNTLVDPSSDTFDLVLTDSDSDTASTTLVVAIQDDVPTANDDADSLGAGEFGPVTGNVLSNDVQGADGAGVASFVGANGSGDAGETVAGEFGTLTINADGTYSYTRNAETPGGVTDTFTYSITDGDGDISTADLVITIGDAPVTIEVPEAGGDGTLVEEAGLAGPPAGSAAGSDSEFTEGAFTFTAPDGPAVITIDGVEVTSEGQTFAGDFGTLTIDAIEDGSISYTYELTANTDGDATSDTFDIVVTDQDGDSAPATLEIAIVDDVPTAVPDVDSVTEDGPPTADGNVLTGAGGADANDTDGEADTPGADGASVTGVAFGSPAGDVSGNVGTSVSGAYGSLTIGADGAYVYTLDNENPIVQGLDPNDTLTEVFTYTITDGDGDTSTTTVTITVNGADDPVVINGLDGTDAEEVLDEDDLPNGSSPNASALTQTGSFTIESQDGLTTLTVGGETVFDANNPITFPVTIDDPDFGLLTITGIDTMTDANGDVVSATVNYTYVLQDNSLLHTGMNDGEFTDSFAVVAADTNGSFDTASLDITIVDDTPTAVNDTDSLTEGGATSTSGNVISDTEANGDDGADTPGADGAQVQTPGSFDGEFGTLELNADGSYTYTLSAFGISQLETLSDGEVFTEAFDYVLVDGDGDTSPATLTITLNGEDDGVTVNDLDGEAPEVILDEDDLANDGDDQGSDQSNPVFEMGVFSVTSPDGLDDVQINGVNVVVDGVFAPVEVANDDIFSVQITGWTPTFAADGVTVISAVFNYTATLLNNTLEHIGPNDLSLTEMLNVTADDQDGSSDSAVLDVQIIDDTPTANDDLDRVGEGETADGNLVTGVGGEDANDTDGLADVTGADGAAADGAVVDANFVSANQDITLTSKAVAGDGTITITTSAGVLTVNPDGAYAFASAANSINGDAQIIFNYIIEDGDGDQDTATLTIDIDNVGGDVLVETLEVDEAGLPDGTGELSDPAPESDQSEVDSGQITVENATGTFTFVLTDASAVFDDGGTADDASDDTFTLAGQFGTLVLNASTGAYTYTLTEEFDHDEPPANTADRNEELMAEQFDVRVDDSLGNTIGTATIDVTIIDDIPEIDVTQTGEADVVLLTRDAETEGNLTSTDSTSASFEGVFGLGFTAGADGAVDPVLSYALAVTNIASGLTSGGAAINLFVNADGDVIGSTAANLASVTDENTIFDISVDDDGVVTLSQFQQVDHTNTDPSPTDSPFDDQIIALANGAVTLTASSSITDVDGDTVSDSEVVDLGGNIQFADDGPSFGITTSTPLTLVTDDGDTNVANNISASASAQFGVLFDPDFGADGPAAMDSIEYVLAITGGDGEPSGLRDAVTDENILLRISATDANVIEGYLENSGGVVAFTISVDPETGEVTQTQFRAIEHDDENDPVEEGAAAEGFAADLITLTANIEDFDGDTATQTVSVGNLFTFVDDGPAISAVLDDDATVVVDESDLTNAVGSIALGTDFTQGSDSDVAGNSGETTLVGSATTESVLTLTTDFGEDGAAAGGGLTFELVATDDTFSGLTTTEGTPINLVQVSATVVAGVISGTTTAAFAVQIDTTTGVVSVEQYVSLDHPDNPDPNDDLQLTDDVLSARVTATDGDQDTDTSADVSITSLIIFLDDGPELTNVEVGGSATVDETDGFNNGFPISATSEFSILNFDADFGSDGGSGATFSLNVTNAMSGLETSDGDFPITLVETSDTLITGVFNDGTNDQTAFAVEINSNGTVTLTQNVALEHSNELDPNDAIDLNGLVEAIVTITDGDGDTDSVPVQIGASLTFLDDGPSVELSGEDVDLQVVEGDGNSAFTPFESVFTFSGGADGTQSIAYSLNVSAEGVDSGIVVGPSNAPLSVFLFLDGDNVVGRSGTSAVDAQMNGETVFTVSVGETSGIVTLTVNSAINHAESFGTEAIATLAADNLIQLVGTITDNDGDIESINHNIGSDLLFFDTVPDSDPDTDTVIEGATLQPLVGVLANDTDSEDTSLVVVGVAAGDSAGVAVSGNVATAISTPLGTLTLLADGTYTYVSNPNSVTDPGAQDVFTYTAVDADGDLTTTTLTINIDDVTLVSDAETAVVNEAALDLVEDDRGTAGPSIEDDLAPGTVEGSDPTSDAETVTGELEVEGTGVTFALVDPISGLPIGNDSTLSGTNGVISLNADGTYSYTLTSPVTGVFDDNGVTTELGVEVFNYTATDANGNTVSGTITINVIDDVPTARADIDTIAAGGTFAEGNVITGAGTDDPAAGADESGADRPITVIGVSNAADAQSDFDPVEDFQVTGEFGSLTIQADGSYEYTRADGSPGGVQDVFTYTIVDADGDTSEATLTIDIGDLAPVAVDGVAQLDDDGLENANTMAGIDDIDADAVDMNDNEAIFDGVLGATGGDGQLSFAWTLLDPNTPITIGQETVVLSLSGDDLILSAVTSGGSRPGTTLFQAVITDATTGAFTVTLLENVLHAADGNNDENGTDVTAQIGFLVTDVDGDSDNGTISIDFNDDVPTLGPIDDQAINNDASLAGPEIVGVLNLSAGADGLGEIDIDVDVTGLTVGGQPLTTSQTGNVLTASNGDVDVFTITVDPNAGGSGTYEFDLLVELDGEVTDIPIGDSTAFGAGPNSQGQLLNDGDPANILTVLSGFETNGSFQVSDWFVDSPAGTFARLDPTTIDTGEVNSATSGFGLGNRAFNESELFVFDFGAENPLENPDGAGVGFEPPANINLPDITFATFDFVGARATDEVLVVARFTDGSSQAVSVTGDDITGADNGGFYTFDAPPGLIIDSIEILGVTLGTGGTAVLLSSVGVADESIDVDIPVTISATDGDGDVATQQFNINVSDAAVAINDLTPSIVGGEGELSEGNLSFGSTPGVGPTTLTGDFTVDAPDGLASLIIGGIPIVTNGVLEAGPLVIDTPLGQLTITNFVPNADGTGGTVTYDYVLQDNADHTDDALVFDNIAVEVSDVDGDIDGDTLSIQVLDDTPFTAPENVDTVVVGQDINAAFVLDFSGSVSTSELDLQLRAVNQAAFELFQSTTGDVAISLIIFSGNEDVNSADAEALALGNFSDFLTFAAAVDALNPVLGGDRQLDEFTNFSAGIDLAIDEFGALIASNPTANNQLFFLSDGVPNRDLGPGGVSLTTAVADEFTQFVADNSINVTSIGIGTAFVPGGSAEDRLEDVDVDGDVDVILADDFASLVETLISAVVPPVSGNVLDNDTPTSADGVRILSVEIDGVLFTFDGAGTITPDVGDPIDGSELSVVTSFGGTFTFNFANGEWTYVPASSASGGVEDFLYTVVDGDGDTSSANLTIDVAAVSQGANFAQNDAIITNASSTFTLDESVLLANDGDGTVLTGIDSFEDASNVTLAAGTITFSDNDSDGGNFIYNATNGGDSDAALVTVNRAQAGESTLDGTSANDILVGTSNDELIQGELGADILVGGGGSDEFDIDDGESLAIVAGSGNNGTVSGFDTILDFDPNNDEIDFTGTVVDAIQTAGTDGTDSTLTVNGETIKSHSVVNGIITFDDSDTFDSALTLSGEGNIAAAVDYLQQNDIGAANSAVAFVVDGDTFIYFQDNDIPSATQDSLVKLANVVVTDFSDLIDDSTVRPVVLDLDGDGVEFVGLDAGVTFDYDGDGIREATAWAGADDAILAFDANNDGLVTDASEFVFGDADLTDLEAVAARFDSNGDGVLDASDAAYSQFGIWQDANLNGVNDDGEFTTLAEAGIVSINLVSDGQETEAADGDVTIFGTASFTFVNGQTNAVADAAFATERQSRVLEQAAAAAVGVAAITLAETASTVVPADSVDLADASVSEIASAASVVASEPSDVSFDAAAPLFGTAEVESVSVSANILSDGDEASASSDIASEDGSLPSAPEPTQSDDQSEGAQPEASAFSGFADGSAAQALEALLLIENASLDAEGSVEAELGETVEAVLADIAAENLLDQLIDNLSDGTEQEAPIATDIVVLGDGLLNQTLESSIVAIEPRDLTDGQLDQVAAAAVPA